MWWVTNQVSLYLLPAHWSFRSNHFDLTWTFTTLRKHILLLITFPWLFIISILAILLWYIRSCGVAWMSVIHLVIRVHSTLLMILTLSNHIGSGSAVYVDCVVDVCDPSCSLVGIKWVLYNESYGLRKNWGDGSHCKMFGLLSFLSFVPVCAAARGITSCASVALLRTGRWVLLLELNLFLWCDRSVWWLLQSAWS